MSLAPPSFEHLARMSTPLGLYEHALLADPRPEHGYCVDDVARALVVTSREPVASDEVRGLAATYLRFVLDSVHDDGQLHNRRLEDGGWADEVSTEDHWGRAIWALGVAAGVSPDPVTRAQALEGARTLMAARTSWPRSIAYAALGAVEVLRLHPDDRAARRVLGDARALLGQPRPDAEWPWPEPRLTYANAVLPEALIAIGAALEDPASTAYGLSLLAWLVDQQTHDGHVSVVPVGGRRAGDAVPSFDQQPIEVSALAEACARAFLETGDRRWAGAVDACLAWFDGDNDAGLPMMDRATGAGYDGLHPDGVNLNQGAESTLAAIATVQLARLVAAR